MVHAQRIAEAPSCASRGLLDSTFELLGPTCLLAYAGFFLWAYSEDLFQSTAVQSGLLKSARRHVIQLHSAQD